MADTFHGPRSRENARLLLKAAEELGLDARVVRTVRGGYEAPAEVVEAALEVSGIEEGKEYPAPDEAKDDAGDGANEPLTRPNNGASREDWKNYAESVGVEVTADDKRDGIIEKVDAKEGAN